MRRRTSKLNDTTMAGAILAIILILGVIFLVTSLIVIIKDPVTFAIKLDQKNIPKNTDGILIVTVKNYWFNKITNLSVTTEVIYPYDPQTASRNLKELGLFDSDSAAHTFKTNSLPLGSYTIKSVLVYTDSSSRQQRKELTLEFRTI